jgi:hypothetical protein
MSSLNPHSTVLFLDTRPGRPEDGYWLRPRSPKLAKLSWNSMGMMGGCPCSKNMAMMMNGMKSDDSHKGMDMPKQ